MRYKYNGVATDELNKTQRKTIVEINSSFSKGILKWERSDCFCNAKDDLVLSLKELRGLSCRIVFCKSCGLIR